MQSLKGLLLSTNKNKRTGLTGSQQLYLDTIKRSLNLSPENENSDQKINLISDENNN